MVWFFYVDFLADLSGYLLTSMLGYFMFNIMTIFLRFTFAFVGFITIAWLATFNVCCGTFLLILSLVVSIALFYVGGGALILFHCLVPLLTLSLVHSLTLCFIFGLVFCFILALTLLFIVSVTLGFITALVHCSIGW